MPPRRTHVKGNQEDDGPDIDRVSNAGRPKWSTFLTYWLPKSQLTTAELTDLIAQTKENELTQLQAAAHCNHLHKPTEVPVDWLNYLITWCESRLATLL